VKLRNAVVIPGGGRASGLMERRVGFGDFGEILREGGVFAVDWKDRGLPRADDVSDGGDPAMGVSSLRVLEIKGLEMSGRDFAR
jgi:hypothetical protein